MKNDFLQRLRRLFAVSGRHVSPGAIIHDAIKEIYLPGLEEEWEAEPDEGKKAKIERIMEAWRDYGERGSKGDWWTTDALKTIVNIAKGVGLMSHSQQKDFAEDVTTQFYEPTKDQEVRAALTKILKFDYMQGPSKLMDFWHLAIAGMARDLLRESRQWRTRAKPLPRSKDDESIELDVPDKSKSRYELQKQEEWEEDVIANMRDWVRNAVKGRDDGVESLFGTWEMIADEKRDWQDVNKRQLKKVWMKETGYSEAAFRASMNKIEKLMAYYVVHVEGVDENKAKSMGITARVASNHLALMRRRVLLAFCAKWRIS